MSKRKKKTLVAPKMRLLLSIYLQGFPEKIGWRRKLQQNLGYEKGNLSTHLTDLLDENLIESRNQDKIGPPYIVTAEGKKLLTPIIFTQWFGMFMGIYVGACYGIFYILLRDQPLLVITLLFPMTLISVVVLSILLIFYPYILLKLGRKSY